MTRWLDGVIVVMSKVFRSHACLHMEAKQWALALARLCLSACFSIEAHNILAEVGSGH